MNEVLHISGDQWHATRARHIGGSEVAALFGVQPAYALDAWGLWQVKAGRVAPPPVDNERVRWGNRLEPIIAEACAEEQCWTIRKGGYVTDETTPGLGCTLDYEIMAGEPGRDTIGALELKNVDAIAYKRAWGNEEPPLHILLQLQHQLAATGYTWGAVAGLVGGNRLEVFRYEARPRLIADIRKRVAAFWRSIDANEPPVISGSDSAAAILRALHAEVVDEELDLTADNEAPDICAELLAATEARKQADKAEAEWKNRLVEKLGGYKRAVVQGFRVNVSVTPAKPDRPAMPDEIIKGRAEVRRYTVKEITS